MTVGAQPHSLADLRRSKDLLFAPIDVAASGDNSVVPGDASRKIKVTSYLIVADADLRARWKSGASKNLAGAMKLVPGGGVAFAATAGSWLLEGDVGSDLVLNLDVAAGARGHLSYFLEE